MYNGIRTAIKTKNNAHNEYIRSGMRHINYAYLENWTSNLSELSHDEKFEYHRNLGPKLINPATSAKTCWSILKTFANVSKIPFITNSLITILILVSRLNSIILTISFYIKKFFKQQFLQTTPYLLLISNEALAKINFDEQLVL